MTHRKIQLFIFPYAGASSYSFRKLTDRIDDRIEVVVIEYSGRGTRAKEPLCKSWDEQVDDAIQYLCDRRNKMLPCAFLGYSMGTIIAYEILVRKVLCISPIHFFLAAEVAPHTRALELRQEKEITEEKIIKRARELGGLDDRLLGNNRFRKIYLEPMISDFRHFFEYNYLHDGEKSDINTTFFYCEDDTKLEDVKAWEQLFLGKSDYYECGKNHFFINSDYELMADVINKRLIEYI